jgi:O-antigen/teichoic acid export membrane protein
VKNGEKFYMSVRKRIQRAMAANAFGQAVTIVTQVLLTPLYFRLWGAELYGTWLLLSSIPAYLAMADMGVGSAAANEMTIRAGAGDYPGAQGTYRSALYIAVAASAIAASVGMGFALFWHLPQPSPISQRDAQFAIALLSLNVAQGFFGSVISGGFRAAGRNALGISLTNVGRMLEAVAAGVVLVLHQGLLTLCVTTVLLRTLMLLVQLRWLRYICPWLFTPRVPAERGLFRRLIKPSLGFMLAPLSSALALQAPLFLIGTILGAPAVAMFAATRTLARVPLQLVNLINTSIWPEFSLAYGAGNMALLRRLHRTSWGVTTLLVGLIGTGFILFGSWIAHHWLGVNSPFDQSVLTMLVLISILTAVWNVSSVILAASNSNVGLVLLNLGVNTVSIALAWVGIIQFGWWGLLIPLVLSELMMFFYVLPKVWGMTQDSAYEFFNGAVMIMVSRVLRRA